MVVTLAAWVLGRITSHRGADFKVYRGIRVDTSVGTKGRWDRLGSEEGKGHRL